MAIATVPWFMIVEGWIIDTVKAQIIDTAEETGEKSDPSALAAPKTGLRRRDDSLPPFEIPSFMAGLLKSVIVPRSTRGEHAWSKNKQMAYYIQMVVSTRRYWFAAR
jgi:hypothetical protein